MPRFRLGPPPTDDTISEEEDSWRLVREPSTLTLGILAICVALIIAACISLAVSLAIGPSHMASVSWPLVILFILLIIPIHELLHAVGFEDGLASNRIVFGFYPKLFACYAHYIGHIPRSRFILIAALPFLILTIIPLAMVAVFCLDYVHLTEAIISNGLASAGDILTIVFIFRETPPQSILTNSGMKTYWKPVANLQA